MPAEPPIYDLNLLLDPAAEPDQRTKVLAEVERILASNGAEIVSKHDWGTRKTAFEIDKKGEAEYHLIQFTGPATVPAALERYLRITDGVIRFRVIKLKPGTPGPPNLKAAAVPTSLPADDETPSYEPVPAIPAGDDE